MKYNYKSNQILTSNIIQSIDIVNFTKLLKNNDNNKSNVAPNEKYKNVIVSPFRETD